MTTESVIKTGEIIKKADFENGKIVIGDNSYRIGDIDSIELIHHLDDDKSLMEVFVGVVDHEARPLFTSTAYKREHIGMVEIESDVASKLRTLSETFDLPVIEI